MNLSNINGKSNTTQNTSTQNTFTNNTGISNGTNFNPSSTFNMSHANEERVNQTQRGSHSLNEINMLT